MKAPAFLLLLALQLPATLAKQKVVSLHFQKEYRSRDAVDTRNLTKRQTITASLENLQVLYFISVSVGTPGQNLKLALDTGSSDLWMPWSESSLCLKYTNGCPGGDFDPNSSTSFQKVQEQSAFDIKYVDGSSASGIFFEDKLNLAGDTVTNQVMGLAERTDISTGIMGISFADGESVCSQNPTDCNPYPSVMEQLVSQKLISSQAYSLWLDDLDSNTGSILFGGVDSSKYTGDLIALPVLSDSGTGDVTSFAVALTGFTLTTSSGSQGIDFKEPVVAILDSGTTLSYLPTYLAAQIIGKAGATYSSSLEVYILPCSDRDITSTSNPMFNYQFGGSSGPIIKVAWDELIEDITYTDGRPYTINGVAMCKFGIAPTNAGYALLGDTFLRSAYVVYDLENKQVAIAQTNFDAGSSNIQEIGSSIPGVSSTASAVEATATATGIVGGAPGSAESVAPSSAPVSAAAATTTSDPLAATSVAASSTSVGTSSAQHTGGAPPSAKLSSPTSPGGLAIIAFSAACALLGSSLIFI